MNNFDGIARFYDALASIVFRGEILKSQNHFIHLIKANSHLLIVGGGSGKVLEALNRFNIPLLIDFVEPSSQMINRAKMGASRFSNLDIHFHQAKLKEFDPSKAYDWICCFYFLDLFEKKNLIQNIDLLKDLMTDQGNLIVSDFQILKNKTWQMALSAIMHTFFRFTTRLESKELKDINKVIVGQRFEQIEFCEFFDQFIFSAVYKKNVFKNGNHS